jgi:predicted PhzF superfamily epimerase YddE/YHI9
MHSISALMSRFGIDEDPVTGSAHCALAPYWFDKFGGVSKNVEELVGFQASARGGLITVKLAMSSADEVFDDELSGKKCKSSSSSSDRVKLSGKCFTTLQSQLLV